MELKFDSTVIVGYASGAQKARRLTETWVKQNAYCPSCGNDRLTAFANNNPARDFFCSQCLQEFELKGSKTGFQTRIVDGAYATMLRRIQANNNPNLFLLNYSLGDSSVVDFIVIPRHFLVPTIIEERRPLGPLARRAGWIGCNILLKSVPQSGKIFLIKNSETVAKRLVLRTWQQTSFLARSKVDSRGWTIEVLRIIDELPHEFALAEIYAYENELKKQFPANNFIRDKIRQQLQILRDRGLISFLGHGRYRKTLSTKGFTVL